MPASLSARLLACAIVTAGATAAAPTAPPSGTPAPNATAPSAAPVVAGVVRDDAGAPVSGATVSIRPSGGAAAAGTTTDAAGAYALAVTGARVGETVALVVRRIGYAARSTRVPLTGDTTRADVVLARQAVGLSEVVVTGAGAERPNEGRRVSPRGRVEAAAAADAAGAAAPAAPPPPSAMPMVAKQSAAPVTVGGRARGDIRRQSAPGNREQYDRIHDNPFLAVSLNPRSTFSLDVDRASYANVRRFLTQGERPPADAVRIEELVNYFPYAVPGPRGGEALAVTTEVAPAPWRPEHRLVRVAVQARRADAAARRPANLVFLVDVSGSMMDADKLPLVKRALGVLVDNLRPEDRVALVVYAGNAGLVLPSTPGSAKEEIRDAIDRLEAGGSTAGGAGLELAYKVARAHAGPGVNSRVVLATDGDFNVGPSSDAEMERLVERRRAEGTYLTVLGFGQGNLQDAKMKALAKHGNGNYAYVDGMGEARKVFGQELGGTLETVANDAKVQVEFNPAAVRAYRLIGYEGRLLRDEDFADDAKDAGDVGTGHTATALYEVVPAGVTGTVPVRGVDPLRYGRAPEAASARGRADELLFVQLRWKVPGEARSRLLTHVARDPGGAARPGDDFRFASAVAEFGMVLRGSPFKGAATAGAVLARARGALGDDPGGHRREFVSLVERYRAIGGVAARE